MIDVAIVKQTYKRHEIATLAFIGTTYNPADALTKLKPSDALIRAMDYGKLNHPVEQWVNRTHPGNGRPKSK